MHASKLWEQAVYGGNWLAARQNLDGGWRDLPDPMVDGFYKASWALTLSGHLPEAHRSLTYAFQSFMSADGDFGPRAHPWHRKVHYVYANAYFILGAVASGRYDIAAPAVRFVLGIQDARHGGLPSAPPAAGEAAVCDTMSAGAAGVASLAAGELGAARRIGEFFRSVIELQPDPEKRFFTRVQSDGTLLTDPPDDAAFASLIDTQLADRCWYAVGLPFAFLVQLHAATGEARYEALARWLFDFQGRCVNPWDGGSSGKAGWACAMLYRITGEPIYREVALRVGSFILNRQDVDGGWLGAFGDGSVTNAAMDVSAEYTLWCALIAANLLARDAA